MALFTPVFWIYFGILISRFKRTGTDLSILIYEYWSTTAWQISVQVAFEISALQFVFYNCNSYSNMSGHWIDRYLWCSVTMWPAMFVHATCCQLHDFVPFSRKLSMLLPSPDVPIRFSYHQNWHEHDVNVLTDSHIANTNFLYFKLKIYLSKAINTYSSLLCQPYHGNL
jgi:hypothetical protein